LVFMAIPITMAQLARETSKVDIVDKIVQIYRSNENKKTANNRI